MPRDLEKHEQEKLQDTDIAKLSRRQHFLLNVFIKVVNKG